MAGNGWEWIGNGWECPNSFFPLAYISDTIVSNTTEFITFNEQVKLKVRNPNDFFFFSIATFS
jgi:hypothetical protein